MILQFLVSGYPYDPDSVQRAIGKMNPALPAMEYPGVMAATMATNDNLSEPMRMACEEEDNGVQESVTVPAGTFIALRIPLPRLGKDIWISPEVPFGVVKMVEPDGKGLELIAHGTGATSSITETPQKMPGAP